MPGADILVGSVVNDVVTISDRFALAKELPVEDTCADWKLVSGSEVDNVTTIEVSRLLDTGDSQDRPIVPGSMKVK